MRKKFVATFILINIFLFLSFQKFVFPLEQTSHVFQDAINWSYQGKPSPKTYWSPYAPVPAQYIFRYKLGFRFSTGTIAVKDSVKVDFSWNNDNAKAGKVLSLKVKPTLKDEDYNTFESSFGVYLPNTLQAGFVSISGVPDILPWFNLPLDFWDLVSYVPKVGSYIASAQDQIGVNMSSQSGLPLGGSQEYSDTRDLISLSLGDFLSDTKKSQAINSIWSKISGGKKSTLMTAVKWAKNLNDAGAEVFLKNLIGSGVDKLANMASLTVIGDPSYKVTGVALTVNLKYWVPGKLSGNYPIRFTSADSEFNLDIPLPIFINDGDKLYITIEGLTYEFKLEQNLKFDLGISIAPNVNVVNSNKVVAYEQIHKAYQQSEFLVQIPIAESDETIMDYKIVNGSISATARWASPEIPLKGTVKLYKDNQKIQEKTEASFKISHNVSFANLTPDTEYKFVMSCIDSSGNVYPDMTLMSTTQSAGEGRAFASNTSQGNATLTSPSASAAQTNINFNWTTSALASTEVYFGSSPDFGENYTGAFKKSTGTVEIGYFGSSDKAGEREMTTSHSIRVTELEPGTTYYYQLVSWTFEDEDDPTSNPMIKLAYVGNISTQPAPQPPSAVIEVKDTVTGVVIGDIPVTIIKQGDQSGQTLITNSNGLTSQLTLEKGKTYNLSVANQPAYQDKTAQFNVPSNQAGGLMPNQVLQLNRKPSLGGNVVDENANPVSGATVEIIGTNLSTTTVTTDTSGHYVFEGVSPGNYNLKITKESYLTEYIVGSSDSYRMFSAPNAILKSSLSHFNITVTAGGVAVNGAQVKVENTYTGVVQNIVTDAQGEATAEISFVDSGAKQFKITVLESAALKIRNTITTVSLEPGISQDVLINCDVDSQAPTISEFVITQKNNENGLSISLEFSEVAKYAVDYYKPDNTLVEGPWSNSYTNRTFYTISGTENPAGLYRIKVKIKDGLDNISETDFVDFVFFRDVSLCVSVSNITSNSAELHWNSYPRDNFGKYKINNNIEITDRDTTSYVLSNLAPHTGNSYTVTVYNNYGSQITKSTIASSVAFTTLPAEAIISDFIVSPSFVELGGQVNITAQLTDPGNVDRKILLYFDDDKNPFYEQNWLVPSFNLNSFFTTSKEGRHSIKLVIENINIPGRTTTESYFTVSGYEKPLIKIVNIPSEITINDPFALEFDLLNADKAGYNFKYLIDWGDGKNEEGQLEIVGSPKTKKGRESTKAKKTLTALKHLYTGEGNYSINIIVTSLLETGIITSDPVVFPVQVKVKPLVVGLTRNNVDTARQTFHIKAKSGSYAVKDWSIDFGNGREASGTGDADKELKQMYQKGDYQAIFTVTDINSLVYTKNVNFRVRENLSTIDLAGMGEIPNETRSAEDLKRLSEGSTFDRKKRSQGTLGQNNEGVDLSIENINTSSRKRNISVDDEIEIIVNFKNNSNQKLNRAIVQIKADDGFRENKDIINLKPNALGRINFHWIPKKAGKRTVEANIDYKDDSNTRNNKLSKTIVVMAKEKLDVSIKEMKIKGDCRIGEPIDVEIIVKNESSVEIKECSVVFESENGFKNKKRLSLRSNGQERVRIKWEPRKKGRQKILAKVECLNDVNSTNNELKQIVEVKAKNMPEIKISGIRVESASRNTLAADSPLEVSVSTESSLDWEGLININFGLKSKDLKEEFRKEITKLRKGKNTLSFKLIRKLKPGFYNLIAEIYAKELSLRKKLEIKFEVLNIQSRKVKNLLKNRGTQY